MIKCGNMNIYDIWIDSSKKCHLITEMDTTYINNCVGQIGKVADVWRCDNYDDLSKADKLGVSIPLQRAWFVVNALDYLYSFKRELEDRLEETEHVEVIINRIIEARNFD